jgi:glycopeptide antibiotics resistance protein
MDNIRDYRIFGVAIFDLVLASIGVVLLMLIFRQTFRPKSPALPYILAGLVVVIPIGIFVHAAFDVKTHLNWKLGLSAKPE